MNKLTPQQMRENLERNRQEALKRFEQTKAKPAPSMGAFRQLDENSKGPTKSYNFQAFVNQGNPAFVSEHPTLSKVLAAPGYAMKSAANLLPESAQNWAERAGQTGGEIMTMVDNPNKVSTGSGLGDATSDLWGGIMGFLSPYEGPTSKAKGAKVIASSGMSIGPALWRAAEEGISDILPRIPGINKVPELAGKGVERIAPRVPVVQNTPNLAEAVKNLTEYTGKVGGATAAFEGTGAIANDREVSPGEMGLAAGANVALDLATRGLLKGIAGRRGIKTGADEIPEIDSLFDEITPDTGEYSIKYPSKQPLALPEGKTEVPQSNIPNFETVGQPYDSRFPQPKAFSQLQEELIPKVTESTTPSLESRKAMVDYIYDGLGGDISKNEIRNMSDTDLESMAQDIANQRKSDLWGTMKTEAEKQGYDLDNLYRMETDPAYSAERERLAEVAGLPKEAAKFKLASSTSKKIINDANKSLEIDVKDPDRLILDESAFENPAIQLADKVANALSGTSVIPAKMPTFMDRVQGFLLQDGKKIILNSNMEDPATYVTMHEATHRMQANFPEQYDKMLNVAVNNLKDDHKALIERYKQRGYEIDEMPDEFFADLMAEMLHDKSFIGKLRDNAPEVIQPLLKVIDEVIQKVKLALSKDDSVLPFIENLERLRSELAPEYKNYMETFANQRNAGISRRWQTPEGVAAKQGLSKGAAKPEPTDTPEFRKWFGDSKVVDESGKPLVAYHGTGEDFNAFDPAKTKGMIWLTGNKDYANEFANNGVTPKELYANLKNPADASKYTDEMPLSVWEKELSKLGVDTNKIDWNKIDFAPEYGKYYWYDLFPHAGNNYADGGTLKALRDAGYDGMIAPTESNGGIQSDKTYVAFEPNQVKSATNRGTWDSTNPDIRYKLSQGSSRTEDLRNMVLAAARQLPKSAGFSDNFKAQILKQFPQVADEPQADAILKFVYDRASELREGQTAFKDQGQVVSLTKKDLTQGGEPGEGSVTNRPASSGINTVTNEPPTYRDISGFQAETQDVARNFKDFYGRDIELEQGSILDRMNEAKGKNVDYQQYWADKLQNQVVKRLGIRKGSILSKLVQQYGEGEISLEQLKSLRPNGWEKVVEADQWFRDAYNTILDDVNSVIAEIYPNQPDKLVPRRKDYYRHFRDLEGFQGFQNMLGSPANISPELAGKSEFVKPKTKWASFKQHQGIGEFKRDAVGGFVDYLPAASYSVNIDPMIKEFRGLSDDLARTTEKTQDANVMIRYLQDYANSLAGKTSGWDRKIQEFLEGRGGSRLAMNTIVWLNNRAKANAVMLNPGSALSQVLNIPNGVAFAKQYSAPGIGRALLSTFKEDPARAKSIFMKERYSGKMYRQFDTKILKQPKNFAGWFLETADRLGTEMIWQSCYSKGLHAKRVSDPVKYADAHTKRLVAGRGIGEMAQIQQSKLFQVAAPFQVEVGNLWKVQKDFVKEKDFTGLATLYVGLWVANNMMENIRGQRIAFDPINSMIEASKEIANPDNTTKDKALKAGGRLAGEILGNIPGGQTVAAWYPEYGNKELGLPTRKELFGSEDPTRWGTGPLVAKAAQDPLKYLVFPYGGAQLDKAIRALTDLNKGGAYSGDKLKYPVKNNTENAVKGLLFGPGAFDETKEYYNEDRRPLSENQTAIVDKSGNRDLAYRRVIKTREINALSKKMKEVQKDKTMSATEKEKRLRQLRKEMSGAIRERNKSN